MVDTGGVDALISHASPWLSLRHKTGIVISSRVRLARNVRGHFFPGWAGEAERVRICQEIKEACYSLERLPQPLYFDMGTLDHVDKEVLKERRLISNELAQRGTGSAVMASADERIAIMINEEDHLRLQAILPGMNLAEAWTLIDGIDSEMESYLEYEFSQKLGYVTACPSNLGTALRASVMLHLPGLKLADEVGPVINGLERIGFAVRGVEGEGTEAHGNLFQVSNQMSLGETEADIIERLVQVVSEIERHEENARLRLLESRRAFLLDQIGRALGILLYARVLASREALDLLSGVRLGIELGLVRNVDVGTVNELLLLTQPGHLQRLSGQKLSAEERDELRAQVIGQRLKGAGLKGA